MPATRECLEFLVEAANDLGADEDRFCLIGGWAVYALTEVFQAAKTRITVRHRGSLDVDLSLAVPRLSAAAADRLRGRLEKAGYVRRSSFRWRRAMPSGHEYDLDLMMVPPAGHTGGALHIGSLDFAPFWNGEAALRDTTTVLIRSCTAAGQSTATRVHVADAAGLVYAKTLVASFTHDQPRETRAKHLFDVYALTSTYPGGQRALAERLRETLSAEQVEDLAMALSVAFEPDAEGVRLVAEVIAGGGAAPDRYFNRVEVPMRRLMRELGAGWALG